MQRMLGIHDLDDHVTHVVLLSFYFCAGAHISRITVQGRSQVNTSLQLEVFLRREVGRGLKSLQHK